MHSAGLHKSSLCYSFYECIMRKDININFQSHRTYNLFRILMNKLIQRSINYGLL